MQDETEKDQLAPYRGCIYGIVVGLVLWGPILVVAFFG